MTTLPARRPAVTLVEVLVAVAVVAALTGLGLAAVQKARSAAARAACGNHLRQVALAVHGHIATGDRLPAGCGYPVAKSAADARYYAGRSWHASVLGPLGEDTLARQADDAFARDPGGYSLALHGPVAVAAPAVFRCPTEPLARVERSGYGVTSYLGVAGTRMRREDGLLHDFIQVRPAEVNDGLSNTLLAGERPPPPGGPTGEWYGLWGTARCGAAQLLPAGVVARFTHGVDCDPATKSLAPGNPTDDCAGGHFWSLHPGGANFAFADGAVRFLRYEAADLLPAMATRAGGETVHPD